MYIYNGTHTYMYPEMQTYMYEYMESHCIYTMGLQVLIHICTPNLAVASERSNPRHIHLLLASEESNPRHFFCANTGNSVFSLRKRSFFPFVCVRAEQTQMCFAALT